jgi:hypothetical protein
MRGQAEQAKADDEFATRAINSHVATSYRSNSHGQHLSVCRAPFQRRAISNSPPKSYK